MKAKTLLIAAAALAAGVMHSQAQVYSQNIVGYVNVPLTPGYNMIANQLDLDGTGTNNTVISLFGTNLQAGGNTTIYAWNPTSQQFSYTASYISGKSGYSWSGDTNDVQIHGLQPGNAFFIKTTLTNNITFVGNVIQGTNVNVFHSGYNFVASTPPVGGSISTALNYIPSVGDSIYTYNAAGQTYGTTYNYISGKSGASWSPSTPSLNVGQGVFIKSTATVGWTNILNVQ